jgi:hypothetical protein
MTELEPLEPPSREKLNQETGRIAWKELQRFFAAGVVIVAAPDLDLVEVAYQFSVDNQAAVAKWMEAGLLAKVSDDLAREWLENGAELWSVVVKPWVLVQDRKA